MNPRATMMQFVLGIAALMISSAALLYAVTNVVETRNARGSERNAKLVEIGVSILRVDPQKESQVSAARKWALDLIDANAGGVRFSSEARAELLQRPFLMTTVILMTTVMTLVLMAPGPVELLWRQPKTTSRPRSHHNRLSRTVAAAQMSNASGAATTNAAKPLALSDRDRHLNTTSGGAHIGAFLLTMEKRQPELVNRVL